ncbi:MAG: hypothetical protein AB1638_09650 [Nitrospirota bacterium]
MSWQVYRIVFGAKSPLHIGFHKLGFIQRTRYYITGRNMWGAITANLARTTPFKELLNKDKLEKLYTDVGNKILNEQVLVSYFFAAIDYSEPLLPCYTDEGLVYGSYPSEVFERLFIRSFGETAIEPTCNTAEEGSLHETEFISPVIDEDNQQKQVYFVGYIFIKEGATYEGQTIGFGDGKIKINDAIEEILVGGERKYGFGRLAVYNSEEMDDKGSLMFGSKLILNDTKVRLEIEKDRPIPFHLDIETKVQMKGDIEPLVGREWGEVTTSDGEKVIGAGQRITEARICWVPGSILQEPKTLKIGPYGILE